MQVTVYGQDTTIFIDLPEVQAYLGDSLQLPIALINLTYPIAGYSIGLIFDRPGLAAFNPSDLFDTSSTLSSGWEQVGAFQPSAYSVTLVGIADFNGNGVPPPIPPLTLGETLVRVVTHIPCDADTFSGTTVSLVPSGIVQFSDPDGNLIVPISASGGTIQVHTPLRGDLDHSGTYDILDVIGIINCAFRGTCPACANLVADLDCSNSSDILDVVLLIGVAFRGETLSQCP